MSLSTTRPIGPILAAVRSVPVPPRHLLALDSPVYPFVTISRQPGAGSTGVGKSLVEAINANVDPDHQWTFWDRELVEKIAADHKLSARLVEGLEDKNHSWIGNFLSSLSFTDSSASKDEDTIYQKVKKNVRALAAAGRVVLVGRGGVFITHDIPGGIHVRLVAPLKNRVAFMAEKLGLSQRAAAIHIRELERNRRKFFKMHWPSKTLAPDTFALTINTAEVQVPSIVQMLLALAQQKIAQAAQ